MCIALSKLLKRKEKDLVKRMDGNKGSPCLRNSNGGISPKPSLNKDIITPNDFQRSLISTRDCLAMYYKEIGNNEKPYTAKILKLNNDRLLRWKCDVLDNLSNGDGMVETSTAVISLHTFLDGEEMKKLLKVKGIEDVKSLVDKGKKSFEFLSSSSLEELYELGNINILEHYENMMRGIKLEKLLNKHEKLYSKSDDPVEWYKLSRNHKELFSGEVIPFGVDKTTFKDVMDKLACVTQVQINPYF